MKKILLFSKIIVIVIIAISLSSCNNKVTIELNGGTLVGSYKTNEPTKEGYVFDGWVDSNNNPVDVTSNIANNTKIYATWSLITKFSIFYQLNGGIFVDDYPSYYYTGDTTELPTPEKEYHVFEGWYDNPDFENDLISKLSSDTRDTITLYAKWRDVAPYQNIIYHLDDGTIIDDKIVKYIPTKTYSLPRIKKENFFFRGYYDNPEKSGTPFYKISADFSGELNLYPNYVEASLENSYISIYGDSISTFNNYLPTGYRTFYPNYDVNIVNDTWWHKAIENTNATLCVNASYSGSKVSGGSDSSGCSLQRIKNIKSTTLGEPDIIIIYLGINDCTSNVSLKTFEDSYVSMVNSMQNMYPNLQIFICNLPLRANYPDNRNDLRISYNNFIENFCIEEAIPLIDFNSVFNENDKSSYLADGLHPNKEGMIKLSNKVVEVLNNYYSREN